MNVSRTRMLYNMRVSLFLQVIFLQVHIHLVLVHGIAYSNLQYAGKFYKDLKFAVPGNPFKVIKILTDFDASLRCARACASEEKCQAFNIFKNETAYFCEMLPVNMRVDQTQIAYVPQSGAVVWEKTSETDLKPFLDEKLAGVANSSFCETIKPGCRGTWPYCTDCVKSCIDCYARDNSMDSYSCIMWPGPTEEENTPIITSCYKKHTHLMRRAVDLGNGDIIDSYIMPFRDMNRLCRLNAYSTLQFFFTNGQYDYQALYSNPYISENGTLMNLTFNSSSNSNGDGLNLGSRTLQPTPFATVSDDKYNCGSFWLFDTNNATHCPGGKIGFFGTPKLDNAVIDSGIHWPLASTDDQIIDRAYLALYME